MEEAPGEVEVGVVEEDDGFKSASLESRMRARRDEVENLVSAKFPLPRYESIIAVELRYLGYERQRQMYEINKRQTMTMRELYTACDQILAATLGFFELRGADDEDGTAVPYDWTSLAQGVLGSDADELTPRQAMIALISAEQVPTLYADWQAWMRGEQSDVDREVGRDFQATN